ncbi:homocysteine biosynthesis protein [Methanosalsum natronophilum]|nr:homocysteine biosynthesis protein [Methanosalsum natronophilum]MCS3924826.1 uncharacterized protein (DUF39 family)/predicted transcriptional regulator [Methanosalsum natronophilum]
MVKKSIHDINRKIEEGNVRVVTAEEMVDIVKVTSVSEATKEVDVVTTGTFGAMCSSGAWLNFGHSDPPIKMKKVWLNDVEAYTGVAAIDAYIGATQLSDSMGIEYGGAHVIEDLIRGKSVDVHATSYGTDCYPRKMLNTTLTIDDLNQAIMQNPRNAYQKYNVATNSSNTTLKTYMGILLPNNGNVTYSGAGVLSPLSNDPNYETIGTGTRILLGGSQGYVTGIGTQHSPETNFGTMMVQGDMKRMSPEYVKAASFEGYGTSLYVGIGVPIPILNEDIARATAVSDDDIVTNILDYGVPSRNRPTIRQVTYGELRSGMIDIAGKEVPTSSLSSFKKSRQIASELKESIIQGDFNLTLPVERLSSKTVNRPMKQTSVNPLVGDIMSESVVTIKENASTYEAANKIMTCSFNHLPVVSDKNILTGIVTAWDISKAVAKKEFDFVGNIMTRNVITATPNEPIDIAAYRLDQNLVSALPVIDDKRNVVGIITSDDISKLLARRGNL